MTDIVVHAAQGVALPEWMPAQVATAGNASRLAEAVIVLAAEQIGQPEFEPGEDEQRALQAMILEQAMDLLKSMGMEADAALLSLLSTYSEGQLYLYRPSEKWESLELFLLSKSEGTNSFYQSIITRLVELLPKLRDDGIASILDLMELVTQGGWSKLCHLFGELEQAMADGDTAGAKEILSDVKNLRKQEIQKKYKSGRSRVAPARAWIEYGKLVIDYRGQQRVLDLLLGSLNQRVTFSNNNKLEGVTTA